VSVPALVARGCARRMPAWALVGRQPSRGLSASALYEGFVWHRRLEPVEHSFRYPLFMAYLDLGELPEALDGIAGWSARRPAPAWFRRADHMGPHERPLEAVVRDRVSETTGWRPAGPVRVLTNLRYFGHCFNPVSFFYCFDDRGERAEAVLAEVNNTPWGETHAYVLGSEHHPASSSQPLPATASEGASAIGDPACGGIGRGVAGFEEGRTISGSFEKRFHVSPLMGMDHVYEWRTTVPSDRLRVRIESHREGRLAFEATLSLARRPLAADTARRLLIRYPAMTAQILARIYWQALRLRLKGAPWFSHPERSG
jgi:uncharacterized protein